MTYNISDSEILYKAMYEQSQMQLKIFEAMIKADSLSRKYQAEGIYSESAIQAFNEEAKSEIFSLVSLLFSKLAEYIKEWWKIIKTKAERVFGIIKLIFDRKTPAQKAIDKLLDKRKKQQADSDNTRSPIENNFKSSYAGYSPFRVVRSSVDTTKHRMERADDPLIMWTDRVVDWVELCQPVQDAIIDYTQDSILDTVKAAQNAFQNGQSVDSYWTNYLETKYPEINKIADGLFADDYYYRTYYLKPLSQIPELQDGGSYIHKLINEKRIQLSKIESMINKCTTTIKSVNHGKYKVINLNFGEFIKGYTEYCKQFENMILGTLGEVKKIIEYELQNFLDISTKVSAAGSPVAEMAELLSEAVMYEAFISTEEYTNNQSPESIKTFATSKLEAAMNDINDMINSIFATQN